MRPSSLVVFGVLGLLAVSCGGEGDGEGDPGSGGGWSAPDPTCASGERWSGGNEESPLMHPGGTCIGCHASEGEGPSFRIAGTVYAGPNEATDCFGAADAEVVITTADGKSLTLGTNDAGNFTHTAEVVFPLHVKVTRGGKSVEMASPVTSGECNGCHTETGAEGAPGRILAP